MKTKEQQSNTAIAARVNAVNNHVVESPAKKFWWPLILGACLFYLSDPVHAVEQQGTGSQTLQSGDRSSGQPSGDVGGPSPTQRQGAGRGTKPPTDYTGTQSNPGSQTPPRDTTLDTEKMNSGPAPNTENINKDTVGPGGDNMMRDAIPGGSGLNRE